MTLLAGCLGELPAVIVNATDENGELRPDVNGVLGADPVAERVQRGLQHIVSELAISGSQPLHEILQPQVRLLQSPVEHVEARGHGSFPSAHIALCSQAST